MVRLYRNFAFILSISIIFTAIIVLQTTNGIPKELNKFLSSLYDTIDDRVIFFWYGFVVKKDYKNMTFNIPKVCYQSK